MSEQTTTPEIPIVAKPVLFLFTPTPIIVAILSPTLPTARSSSGIPNY